MGYQEYLITARNERDFRELIRLCAEARNAGFYNNATGPLEPLSVAVFKRDVGAIPAGTTALWAAGDRTTDPCAALLPQGTSAPRMRFLPADNDDALGTNGEYTRSIDFGDKTDKSENEYMTRYSLSSYRAEYTEGLTVPGEKLKEFLRRLTGEGMEPSLDEHGVGTVQRGGWDVIVTEDGDVLYKPESRELACRVHAVKGEVDEYMTAFEKAAPGGFPDCRKMPEETRTLLVFGDTELAAHWSLRYGMDFITWRRDHNGNRETGHYLACYADAKEDFAARSGLIDRRKLFTETELRLIRSGLAELGDITPDRGFSEMKAIRALVEKIDDIVIPKLADRERDAENQGFEPEIDL